MGQLKPHLLFYSFPLNLQTTELHYQMSRFVLQKYKQVCMVCWFSLFILRHSNVCVFVSFQVKMPRVILSSISPVPFPLVGQVKHLTNVDACYGSIVDILHDSKNWKREMSEESMDEQEDSLWSLETLTKL